MPKKIRDPYEVLGIKRDASPEEIKSIYRKEANKAHPDKGGSVEKMSDLSQAYALLSDPGRRLLYDVTGEDAQGESMVSRVQKGVEAAFMNAIMNDAPHMLNHAKKFTEDIKSKLIATKIEAGVEAEELLQKRDKITLRGQGRNHFRELIDARVRVCEAKQKAIETDLEVVENVLNELALYESSEVENPVFKFNGLSLGDIFSQSELRTITKGLRND